VNIETTKGIRKKTPKGKFGLKGEKKAIPDFRLNEQKLQSQGSAFPTSQPRKTPTPPGETEIPEQTKPENKRKKKRKEIQLKRNWNGEDKAGFRREPAPQKSVDNERRVQVNQRLPISTVVASRPLVRASLGS